MKFRIVSTHKFFQPAFGAALAVLCGWALWQMPAGDAWVNASYDCLFRFSARKVTNQVALILMDNAAYEAKGLKEGESWDRGWHAELLNKLADDHCPVVVFDVFFEGSREPQSDNALAKAMRRHGRVVLAQRVERLGVQDSAYTINGYRPVPLPELFKTNAAGLGAGRVKANITETVRRHWPFPLTDTANTPGLPWTAARLAGASLPKEGVEQWLRYYGESSGWNTYSYHLALDKAPGFFSNQVVFIGRAPMKQNFRDWEDDKFHTPYTPLNGKAVGGVEILATTYLNLVNDDWLRRPAWWVELLMLAATGILLGGGLCRVSPLVACALAVWAALAVILGAVSWSYYSNYWFPWLIIAGGQVPCALVWALVSRWRGGAESEYVIMAEEPFGKGAYGKVFWAQHRKSREWVALKRVYRANFNDSEPYEREFRGITRYLPVSSQHPGLLHVHYVARDEREGYFFYVMDLGDSEDSGWERNPPSYQPLDLERERARAEGKRLPVRECVRIGLALAEALEFLHQVGLLHRDIKPSNVIFVKGQPRFADVGLVAEIPRPNKE